MTEKLNSTNTKSKSLNFKDRFRGFLPVVVDIEASGINPYENAIVEMCVVLLTIDAEQKVVKDQTFFETVLPFEGAKLDKESLEFANVPDPFYPLRFAVDEKTALRKLFKPINAALKHHKCNRAVLVGHNAWFDLLFIKEAARRNNIKIPFHAFTSFDTATLGGFFYGQTVLSKVMEAAEIEFDVNEAHSAIYDAEKTAELFCKMLNTFKPQL